MFKRLINSEKGQAAVEFALCLPLMLLILAAVTDFGWVFMHELSLSMAVREGARVAIVSVDDGTYIDKARDKVEETAAVCNNGSLAVTVTATNPGRPAEGDIQVSAAYTIQMLTPMAKLLFGGMQYQIHDMYIMRVS